MITQELTHYWPCGCYYQTSLDELGEVCLIRAACCSECFDLALQQLEKATLDRRGQLTLDLPLSVSAPEDPKCSIPMPQLPNAPKAPSSPPFSQSG